mmetsp:Transcript_28866/g.40829  ORF Transcript_28866/g.40829 Transcript_28866/m.40829 type:complete len:130 (+) Transcript_28866:407-796(+)
MLGTPFRIQEDTASLVDFTAASPSTLSASETTKRCTISRIRVRTSDWSFAGNTGLKQAITTSEKSWYCAPNSMNVLQKSAKNSTVALIIRDEVSGVPDMTANNFSFLESSEEEACAVVVKECSKQEEIK